MKGHRDEQRYDKYRERPRYLRRPTSQAGKQCETGGCGGKYDCSKAHLGASVGTTIAEWTFYEPVKAPLDAPTLFYNKDSPDISSDDGVNLTIDIQPLKSSPHDPFDALGGHDIQWLAEQYPLSQAGQDLRAPGQ